MLVETVRRRPPERSPVVNPSDVLRKAAWYIEEFGWCQHATSRDAQGNSVDSEEEGAQSFCLTGAIRRAYFDLTGRTLWSLDRQELSDLGFARVLRDKAGVPVPDQPAWNNDPSRTKAEVVAALRKAAA